MLLIPFRIKTTKQSYAGLRLAIRCRNANLRILATAPVLHEAFLAQAVVWRRANAVRTAALAMRNTSKRIPCVQLMTVAALAHIRRHAFAGQARLRAARHAGCMIRRVAVQRPASVAGADIRCGALAVRATAESTAQHDYHYRTAKHGNALFLIAPHLLQIG